MINIITKYDGSKCLSNFDAFFDSRVRVSKFTEFEDNIIFTIDSAVFIDKTIGTIKTNFGVTDVTKLSSGCKTVISCLNILTRDENKVYRGVALDITKCGWNALKVLFDSIDNRGVDCSDITFILRHKESLDLVGTHDFNINGYFCEDLMKGVILYGEDI